MSLTESPIIQKPKPFLLLVKTGIKCLKSKFRNDFLSIYQLQKYGLNSFGIWNFIVFNPKINLEINL